MPQQSEPFDRAVPLRFMESHALTLSEFAAHAGIPYPTARAVIYDGRPPLALTADRIIAAVSRRPAITRLTNEATIRDWWGRDASECIGQRCTPPLSGAYVRKIAKRLGLPPGGVRARKQAAAK